MYNISYWKALLDKLYQRTLNQVHTTHKSQDIQQKYLPPTLSTYIRDILISALGGTQMLLAARAHRGGIAKVGGGADGLVADLIAYTGKDWL